MQVAAPLEQPETSVTGTSITERKFVENYDRQRRLEMLRLLTPAFIGITVIVIAAIAAYLIVLAPGQESLLVVDIPLVVVLGVQGVSWILVGQERVVAPTVLVLTGNALVIIAIEVIWIKVNGLDLFAIAGLITLCSIIVEAGALGGGWVILPVTLAINVATIVILVVSPRPPQLATAIDTQLALFAPVIIMTQWALGATMFALWRNVRTMLHTVGIAYERAQRLDDLKNQFISSVNHELRTPLTTLQTYIQACLIRFDRLSRQDLRTALQSADRVSRALAELVKEILSTRRIEQDAIGFTPAAVPVRQSVEAAITLLDLRATAAPMRDLHLSVPDDLVVWGDSALLKQILSNLLTNALKYSPDGSPIEVSAALARGAAPNASGDGLPGKSKRRRRRSDEQSTSTAVELIVRDHGLGIPADEAPLLFNRFVRLPRDLASSIVGTGLGLFTCKVYAEAMGGAIWVESEGEGEGSAFHVRLPIAPVDAQPPTTTDAPPVASAGALQRA
ncbi:MAG TPA: HAMP domain-containing sensor histidine kinase [Ktedonobacterales bacterium]|nr:HAMP domain-containing sensor histidine kinase [Ktedonobacterales bacterium]